MAPGSVGRAADLGARLDARQERQHLALDALERRIGVALKAQPSTGVVLLARIRPKPSGQSTRRPSMVLMAAGAAKASAARACSSAVRRCGSPSAQATFSSGVLWLVGKALSTLLGSALRLRISSRRQPA